MFSVGTDIVSVDRVRSLIDKYSDKFLDRVFSAEEQEYCQSKTNPAIHYAGRFAAKEAVIKSIKSSGFDQPIDLRSISIINNADGSPYVNLDLEYNGSVKVSISHTETHAIAFALSELNH